MSFTASTVGLLFQVTVLRSGLKRTEYSAVSTFGTTQKALDFDGARSFPKQILKPVFNSLISGSSIQQEVHHLIISEGCRAYNLYYDVPTSHDHYSVESKLLALLGTTKAFETSPQKNTFL